jgi:hypothetical protein
MEIIHHPYAALRRRRRLRHGSVHLTSDSAVTGRIHNEIPQYVTNPLVALEAVDYAVITTGSFDLLAEVVCDEEDSD